MSLFDTLARELYDYEPAECSHEWEYQPAEYERLDGRETVLQYAAGYYCDKCDTFREQEEHIT